MRAVGTVFVVEPVEMVVVASLADEVEAPLVHESQNCKQLQSPGSQQMWCETKVDHQHARRVLQRSNWVDLI